MEINDKIGRDGDGQNARRSNGAAFSALVLGCLALITLAPAFAYEEGPTEGEGGSNSASRGKEYQSSGPPPTAPAGIGDETVGTLPVLQGSAGIVLRRDVEIRGPSFFIEGNVNDVRNCVVLAQGEAVAKVIPLDVATGRVRMVFPGRLSLALDRVMVESCALEFGLLVPEPASYAYPVGMWGQRTFGLVPQSSLVSLPVTPMSSVGALETAPLRVFASGFLQSTRFEAQATPDLLVVRQRH